MGKRVFLVVLDSFGIGEAPDAQSFNDEGSNTLAAVLSYSDAPFPGLARMGLFDIDQNGDPRIRKYLKAQEHISSPAGWYGRVRELS
ncbi:MAG TPA: phosphopentomutase, partial [Clostridiales bacterium]|nr:phosphopentomutase [Clostridiales bacterium]